MTSLGMALLLLVALTMLAEYWNKWSAKHACPYCGHHGGAHKQDCPFDYLNREDR